MNCIAEEVAMMYADQELPAAEAHRVDAHLANCQACRELIEVLRGENAALVQSLTYVPNARLRALAHLGGSIAASLTLAVPAQWLVARGTEVGAWLSYGANYMVGLPLEVAFRALRTLAFLVVVLAMMQVSSFAMTRRINPGGSGAVVISAQETIDDSVLAMGDTVLVEGKIQGTLLIFGRSLEIRGRVEGDVIAGGQDVRISGVVTGNVVGFAQSVSVSGHVAGNLYAGAQNVHIEKGAQVDFDTLTGSQTITVEGTVGRGVTAGAQTAVIAGAVRRGVTFSGEKLLVRSGGTIGGDIEAEVSDMSGVQVEQGASVAGKNDTSIRPPEKSRWAKPGSYIWEVAVLAGAFVVGWLLIARFPRFFGGSLGRVRSWATVGVGFVALVATPLAVVLACVTLVGIPIGIGGLFLYIAGLYLAKIVVGAYLGRELIGAKNQTGLPTLAGLLAGLVILQAVFFIPFAGGLLKLAVLCLGLGGLAFQVFKKPVSTMM